MFFSNRILPIPVLAICLISSACQWTHPEEKIQPSGVSNDFPAGEELFQEASEESPPEVDEPGAEASAESGSQGSTRKDESNPLMYDPDTLWFAGHENGNLDEWQNHGGFVSQGSGTFRIVTSPVHTGAYAVALTIDTLAPTPTGSHAAYLFFWDQLEADAHYYSAWYYIPSEIVPASWWNIWQWKSTENGNTSESKPMFSIDIARRGDELFLWLYERPDQDEKIIYQQTSLAVPRDTWFQIEAYYERTKARDGQLIVWQDGVELFHITDTATVLEDGTIFWSINNYTDILDPNPCTIFVDDAVISQSRVRDPQKPDGD